MRLILSNDDFGVTHGLTEAVRQSFLAGRTSCASIRTNGAAFEHSLKDVLPTIPGLELALHLNLTEGPAEAAPSEVPHLTDEGGRFRRSFAHYLLDLRRDGQLRREIERELRAQFEKALRAGLAINSVNGHQHVHMIPEVFEVTCRLARDFGVGLVRIPQEPFFWLPATADTLFMTSHLNPLKHLLLNRLSRGARARLSHYGLRSVGAFVGVLYTGRMTVRVVRSALAKIQRSGIEEVEILFHPADVDDRRDAGLRGEVPGYYFSLQRQREKQVLLSDDFATLLRDCGGLVVNHASLFPAAPSAGLQGPREAHSAGVAAESGSRGRR